MVTIRENIIRDLLCIIDPTITTVHLETKFDDIYPYLMRNVLLYHYICKANDGMKALQTVYRHKNEKK